MDTNPSGIVFLASREHRGTAVVHWNGGHSGYSAEKPVRRLLVLLVCRSGGAGDKMAQVLQL